MTGCLNHLARLGRDNAGNTLAIAAASLLPLLAMIGGGIDVSRAYMAKTQLQSACDAGVLAGRKALSKSGSYGDGEKAKATAMFNFNFNTDVLNVDDVSYVTDDNDDGQVLGTATAKLPTLVMQIFDKDQFDLQVDCMAELQIGNADIMFVLDTTGSMGQAINFGEPAKIVGLRDAVRDFHKTINQAVNDNRTRIRYGFVPYSMTVNVKNLVSSGALSTDSFSDLTSYQTRVANFQTGVDDVDETGRGYQTYGSAISKTECQNWGVNKFPTNGTNPVTSGGPLPAPLNSTEYNYETWTKTGTRGTNWNKVDIGTCTRRYINTVTTRKYKFTNWIYQEDAIDTSSFKSMQAVEIATDINRSTNPTLVTQSGDYNLVRLARIYRGLDTDVQMDGGAISTTTVTWNGCIEERKTVPETDFDPIPDDAFDLNFDAPGEDDNTWWHPLWGEVEYTRSSEADRNYYYRWSDGNFYTNANYTSGKTSSVPGHPSFKCPAPMMLFRTVELSENPNDVPAWLNTYVNDLNPEGNTYHDIGMIWGGRLTSPTGLFANNVNLDADKINVSKHIIFMTDGIMEPTRSGYSAYGIEDLDHRIAPNGYESTITSRHNARFSALCEAIKAQGTTIWVVAFGTSMTTSLQQCASDGRHYYASNPTELSNKFKFIASQVADLRLGA